VLLVGDGSVVSRVLQLYLRKEGYDMATIPDDPEGWGGEGWASPLAGATLAGTPRAARMVLIASSGSSIRRAELVRRLRAHNATRHLPILALLGAGDSPHVAPGAGSWAALGGSGPAAPDACRAAECDAAASPLEDERLVWPFRLREVLGKLESLLGQHRVTGALPV
jgi:CheY-like chemotaxis protein